MDELPEEPRQDEFPVYANRGGTDLKQNRPVAAVALFAIAGIFAPGAAAQDYPVKTIRLIVPHPPGGLDASSAQGIGQGGCDAGYGREIAPARQRWRG